MEDGSQSQYMDSDEDLVFVPVLYECCSEETFEESEVEELSPEIFTPPEKQARKCTIDSWRLVRYNNFHYLRKL